MFIMSGVGHSGKVALNRTPLASCSSHFLGKQTLKGYVLD